MTNTQIDIANEEINRRAFDRCWDWFHDQLYAELSKEGEVHLAGVNALLAASLKHPEGLTKEQEGQAIGAAEDALCDAAFKEAEASGELEEFMEPEGHHYTMAYNREEAEYLFHVLAARADDGPLDTHFEFLKPFGITPENIDDEDSDDDAVVVSE